MSAESEREPLRQIQTKHVPAVKAQIGSVLRAARLKRGQSLEAVAQQSRIPKKFLESLENDRFDEFPALVYLRGFLKGYCDHLEVEFEPLWIQIAAPAAPAAPEEALDAIKPKHPDPAPTPKPRPAAHKAAPTHQAPAKPRSLSHAPAHATPPSHAAPASGAPSHGSSALGAIVFALALAGGIGYWIFGARAKAPEAVPVPPTALMPLPRAVEPTVVLNFRDDAWVRVTVDEAVVFEGRAPRGSKQEWKPLRSASMRTTAPEAVEALLNGAPAKLSEPTPEGDYRIELQ